MGPSGHVVAVELTPETLLEALRRRRASLPHLVLVDAAVLPVATGVVDAIFAAGIVHHLGDPAAGLREFAWVCRPGARLALFHPIGRVALAPPRP